MREAPADSKSVTPGEGVEKLSTRENGVYPRS